jgi:hypothetical protein
MARITPQYDRTEIQNQCAGLNVLQQTCIAWQIGYRTVASGP